MALNLSRFFGAKPARETVSSNTTAVNDGTTIEQLEAENGGLDMTPEEPEFGEPAMESGILYTGHAGLGENAIALDTWEHAATDTGLGGPDTTERASILPHIEQQAIMRDGANNITLENFALNRDGAPEPDGIMVWNGEPVSHGIRDGMLTGSGAAEAMQDVFVTEVVAGADGISVFGTGGGVDDLSVTAARELALDDFHGFHEDENKDGDFDDRGEAGMARADHPLADDVAFSMPEVGDEVLLSGVVARTPSGLKFDTEVTDYIEGGATAAKWELSEYDAARNESSTSEPETNVVWDDTDIAHATEPLESKNEVSIESIKIEHEGFAPESPDAATWTFTEGYPARGDSSPLPEYNPKELWEAARREGDARIDSAGALGFESQTRPHADGLRDRLGDSTQNFGLNNGFDQEGTSAGIASSLEDDGPSTLLGDPHVSEGAEGIKFSDVVLSSGDDGVDGDGDADSLADLEIDI